MRQAKLSTLCLLLTLSTRAQTPAHCPIAVEIVSESFDQNTQETLELRVTNVSSMDVKAFVLRLESPDSQGKIESVASQMNLQAGGSAKSRQVLSPGESMDVEWQVPLLGNYSSERLSADYVALIRDSSSARSTMATLQDWGPDQSHLSEQVKGMLAGLGDERARLRRLSDAQGATALSGDLESERAAPEAPLQRSEEFRDGLTTACRLERQRLESLLHRQGIGAVMSDLETDR